MQKGKVVILGGGVAGMSAAHELIERGFEVSVYERNAIPGGKARSMPIQGSGRNGKQDLPGEHGFRFFPRFYKHLYDTMKRIPYGKNKRSVYDNLVDTTRAQIARFEDPDIITVARFPRTRDDVRLVLRNLLLFLFHREELGLQAGELEFFGKRLWQILTTCEARRLEEYDRIGWWEFIEAERKSPAYRALFGNLSRTLVAAQPRRMSTKTAGDILVQLLLDIVTPGISTDRVLNGPTNDVWIYPWLKYLVEKGVQYHINARIQSINCDEQQITGVTIAQDGQTSRVTGCSEQGMTQTVPCVSHSRPFEVQGNYYLAALPVESIAYLINKSLLNIDPTLESIKELRHNVASMNGIMFYLYKNIDIIHGHTNYINSQWALTSISQKQFWRNVELDDYGDGAVNGILSVVISDWHSEGINGKKANECRDIDEIKDEVWAQLELSLNSEDKQPLKKEDLHSCFIADDVVVFPDGGQGGKVDNREPLLINETKTWHIRPEAFTRVPNLFLASDYVRTNTDLATMEAANEAARRAVNCILDAVETQHARLRRAARSCKVWKLHEPWLLWPFRLYDRARNNRGLPWNGAAGTYGTWLFAGFRLIFNGIVKPLLLKLDSHLRKD
jgi:15-cis-phytoene desaturase